MVFTRVIIFMVLGFICFECAVLSGRALFCRDPDSGKLHAVNTTWASMSFCGNYTCKLRKRNLTQMRYTPLRTLNVTSIGQQEKNNTTVTFDIKTQPEIIPILHKNVVPYNENIPINNFEQNLRNLEKQVATSVHKENLRSHDYIHNKITYENMNRNNEAKPQSIEAILPETRVIPANVNTKSDNLIPNDNTDRYLTEKEIDTISTILHTVKKSDLDAIVDIYNLAQDIYKEMDKVTDENLVDETINAVKEEQLRRYGKPSSYWYDSSVNKVNVVDKIDMELQGSRAITTTSQPKGNSPYFNDVLSNKEHSKLPLHYPITSFQRLSSYTHLPEKSTVQAERDNNVSKKPCNKEKPLKSSKKHDYRGLIKPSYLLPYPFTYVHHYNLSDIPTFYFSNPSWKLDYYNRYRYYQPYYNAFIAQVPNLIVNPQHEEIQGIEQRPVNINEINSVPEIKPKWKTESISQDVLNEMRANVDTSKIIKALPLRKLVKIEKVGKVVKLADHEDVDRRSKRAAINEFSTNTDDKINGDDGEYETYLDKVTCKTQTVPGFFRIGNMSQPFPKCCPQLIKTTNL